MICSHNISDTDNILYAILYAILVLIVFQIFGYMKATACHASTQSLSLVNRIHEDYTIIPKNETTKETEAPKTAETEAPKTAETVISTSEIVNETESQKVQTKRSNSVGKKRSKSVPREVRLNVWINRHGYSMEAPCYCCGDILTGMGHWHAGHIIARANGGSDTVENMRPVCARCNISMRTKHMDDFKAELEARNQTTVSS